MPDHQNVNNTILNLPNVVCSLTPIFREPHKIRHKPVLPDTIPWLYFAANSRPIGRLSVAYWGYHGRNTKRIEVLKAVETRHELVDMLKSRQKRWIGHVTAAWQYSDNSDRRATAGEEGKREAEENGIDRWLLKTKEGSIDYAQLKQLTQGRSKWRQWKWKLPCPYKGRTEQRKSIILS